MSIERLLNSVGVKIFIEYFEYFSNTNLTVSEIIEILPDEYTENSRRTRISKARIIIKDNILLQQSLEYIINSKRIDPSIKDKAIEIINQNNNDFILYPDEIDNNNLHEGTKKQITVNAYERNPHARKECIQHYGYKCQICEFDFEKVYGEIGKDFIHVHHKVDISTIGENYKVNPIKDLIPVCPNCHAMLHKIKPAYSPEEIKNQILKRTYNKS